MAENGKNPKNGARGYSFISIFSCRLDIAKSTQNIAKSTMFQKKMLATCQFWEAIPPKNTSPPQKTPNLSFLAKN